MKHVDPNKISVDKYSQITVENNSTGFLVLKYICLQDSESVIARDVKICLLKEASIVQSFTVHINPLPSIHVNKIYRYNEPEQRHAKIKITDFVN